MFQQAISSVIISAFGDFIEASSFSQDNLNAGLWSGSLRLNNLLLKPSALDVLDAPVSLVFGCIGEVEVHIPWNTLLSDEGIVLLRIQSLHALIRANYEYRANHVDIKDQLQKQFKLRLYEALEKSRSIGKSASTASSWLYDSSMAYANGWLLDTVILKLINRLEVRIADVHIRYEDVVSCSRPFAIGILFDSFIIDATFLDRLDTPSQVVKTARIQGLSIYMNPMYETSLEPSTSMLSHCGLTSDRLQGIFSRKRRDVYAYILKPVDIELQMDSSVNIPARSIQLSLHVQISSLQLQLEDLQVRNVVGLMQVLGSYDKLQPLLVHRPSASVRADPRSWWRHAYHAVLSKIREKRGRSPTVAERKRHSCDCLVYRELWKRRVQGLGVSDDDVDAAADIELYPGYLEEERAFRQLYSALLFTSKTRLRLTHDGWIDAASTLPEIDESCTEMLTQLERRLSYHQIIYFRELALKDLTAFNRVSVWMNNMVTAISTVFQPILNNDSMNDKSMSINDKKDEWDISVTICIDMSICNITLALSSLSTKREVSGFSLANPFFRIDLHKSICEITTNNNYTSGKVSLSITSANIDELRGKQSTVSVFRQDNSDDTFLTILVEWPPSNYSGYDASVNIDIGRILLNFGLNSVWMKSLVLFLENDEPSIENIPFLKNEPKNSTLKLKSDIDTILNTLIKLSYRIQFTLKCKPITLEITSGYQETLVKNLTLNIQSISIITIPILKHLKNDQRKNAKINQSYTTKYAYISHQNSGNSASRDESEIDFTQISPSPSYVGEDDDHIAIDTSIGFLFDEYKLIVHNVGMDISGLSLINFTELSLELHKNIDVCDLCPLSVCIDITPITSHLSIHRMTCLIDLFTTSIILSNTMYDEDNEYFDSAIDILGRNRKSSITSEMETNSVFSGMNERMEFYDCDMDNLDTRVKEMQQIISAAEDEIHTLSAELRFATDDVDKQLKQEKINNMSEQLTLYRARYVDALMQLELANLQSSSDTLPWKDDNQHASDSFLITPVSLPKPMNLIQLVSFQVSNLIPHSTTRKLITRRILKNKVLCILRCNVTSIHLELSNEEKCVVDCTISGIGLKCKYKPYDFHAEYVMEQVECVYHGEDSNRVSILSSIRENFSTFLHVKYIIAFSQIRQPHHTLHIRFDTIDASVNPSVITFILELIESVDNTLKNIPKSTDSLSATSRNTHNNQPIESIETWPEDTIHIDFTVRFVSISMTHELQSLLVFGINSMESKIQIENDVLNAFIRVDDIIFQLMGCTIVHKYDNQKPICYISTTITRALKNLEVSVSLPSIDIRISIKHVLELLKYVPILSTQTKNKSKKTFKKMPKEMRSHTYDSKENESPLSYLLPILGCTSGFMNIQGELCSINICSDVLSDESTEQAHNVNVSYNTLCIVYLFGSKCSFEGCDGNMTINGITCNQSKNQIIVPFNITIQIVALPQQCAVEGSRRRSFNLYPPQSMTSLDSSSINKNDESETEPSMNSGRIPVLPNQLQLYCVVSPVFVYITTELIDTINAFTQEQNKNTFQTVEEPYLTLHHHTEDSFASANPTDALDFLQLPLLIHAQFTLQEIKVSLLSSSAQSKRNITICIINTQLDLHDSLEKVAIAHQTSQEITGSAKCLLRVKSLSIHCGDVAVEETCIFRSLDGDIGLLSVNINLSKRAEVRVLLQIGKVDICIDDKLVNAVQTLCEYLPPYMTNTPVNIVNKSDIFESIPMSCLIPASDLTNTSVYTCTQNTSKHRIHLTRMSFVLPNKLKSMTVSFSTELICIRIPIQACNKNTSIVLRIGSIQIVSYHQNIAWVSLEGLFHSDESERTSAFWSTAAKIDSISINIDENDDSNTTINTNIIDTFHVSIAQAFGLTVTDSGHNDERHFLSVTNNIDIAFTNIHVSVEANYPWLPLLQSSLITPLLALLPTSTATPKTPHRSSMAPVLVNHRNANVFELLLNCITLVDCVCVGQIEELSVTLLNRNKSKDGMFIKYILTNGRCEVMSKCNSKPTITIESQHRVNFHNLSTISIKPIIELFELAITIVFTPSPVTVVWSFVSMAREAPIVELRTGFSVHATSPSKVQLLITPELIRFILDMTLTVSYTNTSTSCINIHNLTGSTISASLYSIENMMDDPISIDQDESKTIISHKYYINILQSNNNLSKYIIIHKDGEIFQLPCFETKDVLLIGEHGNVIPVKYTIIDEIRTYQLTTTFEMKNTTAWNYRILFTLHSETIAFSLPSMGNVYLPSSYMYYINTAFIGIINENINTPLSILYNNNKNTENKNNSTYIQIPMENGLLVHCIAISERIQLYDQHESHKLLITIIPTLILHNLLACNIQINIVCPIVSSVPPISTILTSGQKHCVNSISPKQACYLSLKLLIPGTNKELSSRVRIDTYNENCLFYSCFISIIFENEAILRVNMDVESTINGQRNVYLYVPFWLISLTSKQIMYKHDEKSNGIDSNVNSKVGLGADQFKTRLDDNSDVFSDVIHRFECKDSMLNLAQIGYTSSDHTSTRLVFTHNGLHWSRSVSISYSSPMSLDIPSPDSTSSSTLVGWIRSVFANDLSRFVIESIPLHDTLFKRTKLVLIYDGFVIENATNTLIEIRQTNLAKVAIIQSNQTKNILLSSKYDQNVLELRIGLSGWSWSMPMRLQRGEQIVRIMNENDEKVCYLSVEYKSNKERVHIIIRQSCAPFIVENHTTFPFILKQEGLDNDERGLVLRPLHKCPFSWNDSTGTKELHLRTVLWKEGSEPIAINLRTSLIGTGVVTRGGFMLEQDVDNMTKILRIKSWETHEISRKNEPKHSFSDQYSAMFPLISILICDNALRSLVGIRLYGVKVSSILHNEEHETALSINAMECTNELINSSFESIIKLESKRFGIPCLLINSSEHNIRRCSTTTTHDNIRMEVGNVYVNIHGYDLSLILENIIQNYDMLQSIEVKDDNIIHVIHSKIVLLCTTTTSIKTLPVMLFIRLLHISHISITLAIVSPLSRSINSTSNMPSAVAFTTVQFLFNVLANIESSKIEFGEKRISHFHGTSEALQKLLLQQYNSQFIANAILALGSFSFIGAPMEMLTIVGSSLNEVFSSVFTSRSPIHIAANIVYKSCAVVSASTGALSLSASRISSSLKSGLSSTGLVDNSIVSFSARNNLPLALLVNTTTGITNLVSEPILCYQQFGVRGVLFGVGRGVVKLWLAPVYTMLDSGSKSLEGVSDMLIPTHLNPRNVTSSRRISSESDPFRLEEDST